MALIKPSTVNKWGTPKGCRGSAQMEVNYPAVSDNSRRNDGLAAHFVAASILTIAATGVYKADPVSEWIGKNTPQGVVITEELAEIIKFYIEDVFIRCQTDGLSLYVESKLSIPRIHPEMNCYVDAWGWNDQKKDLVIWELKTGYIDVPAVENYQMILYTAAILDFLQIDGLTEESTRVRFRVIQPLDFKTEKIKTWSMRASDLRSYFNILKLNASLATCSSPDLTSGPQCKYCLARYACPVAWQAGMELFESFGAFEPETLSPDEIARKHEIVTLALERLKAIETGLNEQLIGLIRSGISIPNYRVEDGVGREDWTAPMDEVFKMAQMLGVDLSKKSIVTPNQARGLGLDANIVKMYSGRKQAGFKLVRDDCTLAKQIFGGK